MTTDLGPVRATRKKIHLEDSLRASLMFSMSRLASKVRTIGDGDVILSLLYSFWSCNTQGWSSMAVYKCSGRIVGRISSTHNSASRLEVDKVQGLRSRILSFTSHVLHPVIV